ncbi:MAG: hypothetical protein ACREQ2_06375 [Candidatus Binatia bacterium]
MPEPTEKTIKQLFALSGNVCAFPDCKVPIIEPTGTITGEICHIKARRKRDLDSTAHSPTKTDTHGNSGEQTTFA